MKNTRESDLEEKFFCTAPWTHFHVRQDGTVRICCMAGNLPNDPVLGNINEEDWESIWKGERYQKIRQAFLDRDPEILKFCKHCTNYESIETSNRQAHNYRVSQATDANHLLLNPRVFSWDLRPSRTCNLACMICSPGNSTRWEAELGTNKDNITETGKANIKGLIEDTKKTVRHIQIIGGEPVLMRETWDMFEVTEFRKNSVELFFNINGTTLGKDLAFLKKLKGYKWVTLDVSIDAIGKAAEYSRYGCKWLDVDKNLRTLLSSEGVINDLRIHPTVSIFNLFRLPEFFEYLEDLESNYKGRFKEEWGNILTSPSMYNIRNLPKDIKELAKDTLVDRTRSCSEYHRVTVLNFLFSYLEQEATDVEAFENAKTYINWIDSKRNNSFLEVNPEFKPWWQ